LAFINWNSNQVTTQCTSVGLASTFEHTNWSWYQGFSFFVAGWSSYWVLLKTFISVWYWVKDCFWLVYDRYITGIETGIKLVEGWYYLKYLYNQTGTVSSFQTGRVLATSLDTWAHLLIDQY
jgi:hypothetical protein